MTSVLAPDKLVGIDFSWLDEEQEQKKILLADTNKTARRILKYRLEEGLGVDIVVASSKKECQEVCVRNPFIVLSLIPTRAERGEEMAQWLAQYFQSVPQGKKPIVAVGEEDAKRALLLRAGCTHECKPKDLVRLLRELLWRC